MKCPNCHLPFAEEKGEKFFCSTCGWLEKIDKEWKSCAAPPPGESPPPPEPEPEPEPGSEPEPDPPSEPDPAAHEPDPAALEPDPAAQEPNPAQMEPSPNHVKKILGGWVTITETNK